jgi:hypothetical protein
MPVVPFPTPAPTPVLGLVQFSATEFLALYPQFTAQEAFLQNNFNLATAQLSNTASSRVQDANFRLSLLYLLTAHITKLLNGEATEPATGLVGRVSDASEGSVSATAEWDAKSGPSQPYYLQTVYGTMYWQNTAQYRTAKYVPARQGNCDPYWLSGQGPSYGWDDWRGDGHC